MGTRMWSPNNNNVTQTPMYVQVYGIVLRSHHTNVCDIMAKATQLHLQPPPDYTSPLPSLASLVTNECLYKAAHRLRHMPPCFQTKGELNSAAFAVQQHLVHSALKTQHGTREKNPLLLPHITTGYNRVPHTILPTHNVCASHSP